MSTRADITLGTNSLTPNELKPIKVLQDELNSFGLNQVVFMAIERSIQQETKYSITSKTLFQ